MAHLLRGKQAGIQNDLSAGLAPDLFMIDDIRRYGLNSQVSKLAYDPVQSLLAVGTKDTQFGRGQIYIFGEGRVSVVFQLPTKASVLQLQFCADKLVCLDSKHDLSIFSLQTKQLLRSYSPPGTVTALHTDPSVDYAMLGMQNGDVLAYDLDREYLAPFRIPYFWKEFDARARISPVVTLSFHPRDIGKLLIGYNDGAVVYSFKQNAPQKFFHYHLPQGAPGGDSDPTSVNMARSPRLTQAVWHPTGTFILTGHEDSSLVIWDPKDGKDPKESRIIMARTLHDTNVHLAGGGAATAGASPGTFAMKEPIFRIAWCANQDPDDTGILVAGGAPTNLPTKGLSFFELGRTPVYQTSSWQILADHFENPKRQRVLPTPPNAEVIDFCLIPRSSPHFAGAQDPIAVFALLSSGEIITLSFPSGLPITPTNQLHPSLTFVHPFISNFSLAPIDRTRWLGMTEVREHGPAILKGGVAAKHPLKRFETRNIVQTAHADGTIRLWDAGHGDEIENEAALQADCARAVGRIEGVEVLKLSLAGATGELAAGLRSGEVIIFRWGTNPKFGREPTPPEPNVPKALTNITPRRDPALKEGLLPFTLLDEQNGPVTALKLADIGFVAAGFEGGSLAVIDLRGPALIYQADLQDFIKHDKRSSFRRSSTTATPKPEYPTAIEFSVMTLEGDEFSSALLHVGTNLGHLATFKMLPDANGRYKAEFVGAVKLDDKVIRIVPISADFGVSALANQRAFAGLREGAKVNGVLVTVTQSGARIFKPATSKGASKSWDEFLCDNAAVTRYEDQGYALVGLFGDGCARAYSIPALKEIGSAKISHILDVRRFSDAIITPSGDILGWVGPAEMALINVWGLGKNLVHQNEDALFNPNVTIPPRPTISNMQWISGSQYVSPEDIDLLIAGPDRPPSKREMEALKSEERQRYEEERAARRQAAEGSAAGAAAGDAGNDEGYWAYLQRQMNERTEKLNIMGDNMERLQDNSAGFASDVQKFVAKQKRGFVMGAVKSKFGF
ncbi:lethal giant larvae like, C-terminal-domain-containing protein [Macrophomina phaseolina]|uniref:Lethal giant larvae like, C-terminal-domain-containing protein n=1 Tax=Macrophomina phaseolina TaxID=35725 RepID=A0ABQ8GGB9_9PEZI|nr:lethal giant larvae like, C-terminal-domain-containing protein [Macrophomina phaseolina]